MPPKLCLIILFPLLGFIINGLVGQKLRKPFAGYLASLAVLAAFVVAVLNVLQFARPEAPRLIHESYYAWMNVGELRVDVALLLDQLAGIMILVVTGIGFLIHLYSVGYMEHDHNDPGSTRYARYFTFLNLFIAFMSLLVLADNYLLMFVGWEGVGLCSYFLIGFWFERTDAAEASKKAFIVNRIGDFGFLLGMMLIFLAAGTLNISDVAERIQSDHSLFQFGITGAVGGITTVTLLLMLGAAGKSAQIPLFTWLPDAMAGPTPVSALIHAATMVTAGVYMAARSSALFEAAPTTKVIVCLVGALTALCAGLTALAHNDIKKVLAYSTVSQLGFMFMGIGAGAYVAAIFHVFTHAFFKACLFLGSGSVIHALHGEQDMRKMGGLAAKMKTTHLTFLVSGLALAGAVPFAGFFSKDEIIGSVFHAGGAQPLYYIAGVVALFTALITAVYTGRQYAQVFLGSPRDAELHEHAHESPAIMTIPLWILAAGSVLAGLLGLPGIHGLPHPFTDWLAPVFDMAESEPANLALLAIGAIVGWAGWIAGRAQGINAERAALPESVNNVSLDRLYNLTVVPLGFALAAALDWIDRKVIDGIVNGVASFVGQIAQALRLTQTSFVRNYALAMALGAAIVIGYFVAR